MTDFAVSLVYFFVGYQIAYGVTFFDSAEVLSANNSYELVKFSSDDFCRSDPAIISGGVAERAKFYPMLIASYR
ncbi:hypothetical protein [Marinomonas gallaica]|uniref:hypothetical protein n=1 Tax=Marinomonas gallaica TaxID=1806667 RepID=UPI003A9451EA